MRRLFNRPVTLLNVTNGAVLMAGTALSILAHDAHGMMRTGAFLAAVTGLFVVWQVREEIEMEIHGSSERNSHHTPAFTPLELKAKQLESTRQERRGGALRKARLGMVLAIAMWLFAGEILHGFGDLLYHSVESTVEYLQSRNQTPSPIYSSQTGNHKNVRY